MTKWFEWRDRSGERTGTARRRSASLLSVVLVAASLSLAATCNTVVPVEVRDEATGQPIPAKITLYNASTGAAVNLGTATGGVLVSWFQNKAYLGAGVGNLDLPSGVWDIWASRGPEWTVAHQIVDASQAQPLVFTLSRAIETTSYLAADFHIHARPSFESALQSPPLPPLPERVLHYLTEGIEVMGSSDHDCIVDYSSTIASLGLGGLVTSLVGVEATPGLNSFPDGRGNCDQLSGGSTPVNTEQGHWNAFPISPTWSYETTSDNSISAAGIYDMMRGFGDSSTLIQLNHPYFATGYANIGWLDKNNFSPSVAVPPAWTGNAIPVNSFLRKPSPVPGSHTQGIDFDVIEMWAGASSVQGRPARDAWFSLMNQGFLKVGTANSDSHNPAKTAGYPRNYVDLGTDDPAQVTPAQIAAAVRAGKVIGTTGPMPTLHVDGAGLGEIVTDTDGTVDVAIKVQAAPWVPVDEIRVFANGALVRTIALTPQGPEPAVRYDDTIQVAVSKDTWILIEAGAAIPANPNDEPSVPYEYSRVTTGIPPLSFTNPVFVDANGNGRFDAPGL